MSSKLNMPRKSGVINRAYYYYYLYKSFIISIIRIRSAQIAYKVLACVNTAPANYRQIKNLLLHTFIGILVCIMKKSLYAVLAASMLLVSGASNADDWSRPILYSDEIEQLVDESVSGSAEFERYNAMRRAVYQRGLTTNEWHVENLSGCQIVDDYHPLFDGAVHVLCFTNVTVAKNSETPTNSFLIVPDNGLWLTGARIQEVSSITESLEGGSWYEVSETNGSLRVDCGVAAGDDKRLTVTYMKLLVSSAEGIPQGALRHQLDDLVADDYNFTDAIGDSGLGKIRPWVTNRYDAVTAPHWAEFAANGDVSLDGHTLRFSPEQLGIQAFPDDYGSPNDTLVIVNGMQRGLEIHDGRGVAQGSWRIRKVGREPNQNPTNFVVWVEVPAPLEEFETVKLTLSGDPGFSETTVWDESSEGFSVEDDELDGVQCLKIKVPNPDGTGVFFYASGMLKAHDGSYVNTALELRSERDVVAHSPDGTEHRLSGKVDKSELEYTAAGLSNYVDIVSERALFTITNDALPLLDIRAAGVAAQTATYVASNTVDEIMSAKTFTAVYNSDGTQVTNALAIPSWATSTVEFKDGTPGGTNTDPGDTTTLLFSAERTRNFKVLLNEKSFISDQYHSGTNLVLDFHFLLDEGYSIYATPPFDEQDQWLGPDRKGWSLTTNDVPCIVTMRQPDDSTIIVSLERYSEEK